MRILRLVTSMSLLVSSPAFGQVFFGPNPVAIDASNPPTMSRPGEVIPGTEDSVIEPGVKLDGFDLRAAELNGIPEASFVGADLFRAALSDLPGANFSQANLREASFSGNMRRANFHSAAIEPTTLGLRGAEFSGADFRMANFTDAILRPEGRFDDARFDGAAFDRASLGGRFFRASFAGATFDQARLSGSFVDADFSTANLEGAHLTGGFQHAIFTGVDMRQVSFETQFRGVDQFLGADFSSAHFSGQSYRALGFTNASFYGADLSGAHFDNDIRFFGNDFRQANFDDTRFKGGHLPFADVRQVDFSEVSSPLNFAGGKYDQFTVFGKEGRWQSFDPAAQGMKYIPATPGDANLDDQITFDDFLILTTSYGSTCLEQTDLACWQRGDFDLDEVVGFADFLLQAESFTAPALANVPEPLTHCLWAWIPCVLAFRVREIKLK